MGGFRRFILFVFSLAGLFALAVLACPVFGVGQVEVDVLMSYPAFEVAFEVCLGLLVAWLVFNLLRAIFSRKPKGSINVMSIDGGTITVTRDAVASQASHIVEALELGRAKDVEVRSGKQGTVTVDVHVTPYESVDVTAEAPLLHEALVTGLSAMCGEHLGEVNVEFLEPQHASSLVVAADEAEEEAVEPAVSASATDPDASGDITIPMSVEKEA